MDRMVHHPNSQEPLLVLPEREDNSMIRGFYSLSRREVVEIELPEAHGKRLVGSSKGWLVTVDESLSIQLLNPYSKVQFQLPHQTTFSDQEYYLNQGFTTEEMRNHFIQRVILSSNPSNPDCIAMAIYSDWERIGFARPGDKAWTLIPNKFSAFTDAIYYKEQFYAINWHGEVFSCDIGNDPKTTMITAPVKEHCYGQKYLVECSGELLQVIRDIESDENASPDYKTTSFSIFRLDFHRKMWVQMKSLGNNSLFLGYNTSFSYCCGHDPGEGDQVGVKRDCIYFTDDYLDGYASHPSEPWGGSDMGIFHLEDGSIDPHYAQNACHPFSPPIWFIQE